MSAEHDERSGTPQLDLERWMTGNGPDVKDGYAWRQCKVCGHLSQGKPPLIDGHQWDCPIPEVKNLSAELERIVSLYNVTKQALKARAEAAEAERDQLRQALKDLDAWCDERRNAPDITTLGMVQEQVRRLTC